MKRGINPEGQDADHDPKTYPKRPERRHLRAGKLIIRMDVLSFVLIGISGLIGLVAGIESYHHKSPAIWMACISGNIFVVACCCYWQDAEWKRDAIEIAASINPESVLHLPTKGYLTPSERAQILVKSVKGEPAHPSSKEVIRFIVRIFNSGKTPAQKCSACVRLEITGKGYHPSLNYNKTDAVGVLGPGAELNNTISTKEAMTGKEAPLTLEAIESFQNTRDVLLHGRIDYEDVEGKKHWTTYCYIMTLPYDGTFSPFKENNEISD